MVMPPDAANLRKKSFFLQVPPPTAAALEGIKNLGATRWTDGKDPVDPFFTLPKTYMTTPILATGTKLLYTRIHTLTPTTRCDLVLPL